jgi:hypothetical protein
LARKFKLQVNSKLQNRYFKLTLNYPVGSRRHPFTEGEFVGAGEMVDGIGFRGSVNDSPLVEGWRREPTGCFSVLEEMI